jgi:hypothetical protein
MISDVDTLELRGRRFGDGIEGLSRRIGDEMDMKHFTHNASANACSSIVGDIQSRTNGEMAANKC